MLVFYLLVTLGLSADSLELRNCYDNAPANTIVWWTEWTSWSGCDCGGGTQTRTREKCEYADWLDEEKESIVCLDSCTYGDLATDGTCQCPIWRTGWCCNTCQHINIPHCNIGQQECGGYPDDIRCTDCQDPYYSAGYGGGCAECPGIPGCEYPTCTGPDDTICISCYGEDSLFRRTSDTQCDRMCAWDDHNCWPGQCSDRLTTSCQCAPGFNKVSTSSETSCQLSPSNTPSIDTCTTTITGPNGEMVQAASTTSTTACSDLVDFYGNFQPVDVTYNVLTEFSVDISSYTKPIFIQESSFGVTDVRISIEVQSVTGSNSPVTSHVIFTGNADSTDVTQTKGGTSTLDISTSSLQLSDGQWLCVIFEASGGGFLKGADYTEVPKLPLSAVPYLKTNTMRRLCYRYDVSPPEHCKLDNSCTYEPLQVSEVVTRSQSITVTFPGWVDPIPAGGHNGHTSGIESYELSVHEVIAAPLLQVSYKVVYTEKVVGTLASMTVNVASDHPRLYALYLEVKDSTDNVKLTRRFVLFDDSSSIELWPDTVVYVQSASPESNYTWQRDSNSICLNWTSHFYNRFYLDNPLLNPFAADPSGRIGGVYEQVTDPLPATGTRNFHGITAFRLSWSRNGGSISQEIIIPDVLLQYHCLNFKLKEGETYTLYIRAIDIAGNSYTVNRTVHIDKSPPDIFNMWLVKDGEHRLFVHDRTDLSHIQLFFEALDPHSGIKFVHWTLGVSDSGIVLLDGYIGINTTDTDCPPGGSDDQKCYCPDIGVCEFYQYTITHALNLLVETDKNIGDHNRNYFFRINATNHAYLSTVQYLEILVDESPPETGVVLEGPEHSPDFDYTSDDNFIAHWHGFVDHESGIKRYRVALSDHCLSKQEMSNTTHLDTVQYFEDLPFTETTTRVPANFTGKMFTTIVALNNAMDMSDPVCSDGIIRDTSAPDLFNITIQNGKWTESIICVGGHAWLLKSDMTRLQLHDTTACLHFCANSTDEDKFPTSLPKAIANTLDEVNSDLFCKTKPLYDQETIVYLPDDHIYLQWEVVDDGSQMNELYIGIGLDSSEKVNPSQMGYTPTGMKTAFNKHHTGIGSSQLFFIFLKAENKAGLERLSTIGPILIDQTPPLYTQVPGVVVNNSHVVVAWETDTFYDLEQTELIDLISFQFGHGGHPVTPLMEWRHGTSSECPERNELCITYPLRKLQEYDTDSGLEFYVSLYIYNKAGHFLHVDTDLFHLPSKYPPGNAIVYDIDPLAEDRINDIDVHFTASTLCARWSGFRHHENITLEFGVGEDTENDNIIRFRKIENMSVFCSTSSEILPGKRYHVLIRSTCSGGQTVSSSNGVTVVTQAYADSNLKVHVGTYCRSLSSVSPVTLRNQTGSVTISIDTPLEIGIMYRIYGLENVSVNMNADHGQLDHVHAHHEGFYLSLTPYVHRPLLSATMFSSSTKKDTVKIVRCSNTSYIPVESGFVQSYWYLLTDNAFVVSAEVGIFEQGSMVDSFPGGESAYLQQYNITTGNIPIPYNIQSEDLYSIGVTLCTQENCLDPILSNYFSFVTQPPRGTIERANIDVDVVGKCFTIDIQWEDFQSESPVLFYQWVITGVAFESVTEWSTLEDTSLPVYQVTKCLSIPHELYRTLFACVRAYTEGEQSTTTCRELQRTSPGAYKRDVVYDIDTSSNIWPVVKAAMHSSNLGDDVVKILHNSELDFGSMPANVGALILHASERVVKWFLTTSPEIPALCQNNAACVRSDTSTNGFIIFAANDMRANIVYYICAESNVTYVEREFFTEILEELRVCSDGFVLDDSPPFSGELHVNHHNGYLTEISHIRVSWDGFTDNIDATNLGYVDSIKSYSYAIGTRTGGDDVVGFADASMSECAALNLTGLSDGAVVYVSVKATDQAGLSTVVTSQELTVDTSPPVVGTVMINQRYDIKYVTSETLNLRPVGFHDDESGIDHYEISIGSTRNAHDIVDAILTSGEAIVEIPFEVMHDGHSYHVTVKAINRATIASGGIKKTFTYDGSSPTGGHVIDGPHSVMNDIDFQSNIHHIMSHWRGFDDIHSGVKTFRVGLGLRPFNDDIEAMIDVGLNTEIIWNGSYVPGQRYYTTVEACNNADLCTKMSSNGVVLDNSPPIYGRVRAGSSELHKRYIPRRTSAHLHWDGFLDPQSGIHKYEACIGTQPGQCDIEPKFTCLLQTNIFKTGLALPGNKNIFATVFAYNNVGMRVEQSSDAFQVDDTPPNIVSTPVFLLDLHTIQGFSVQWDPSILILSWMFEDDESPIMEHLVTLKTHHEGHTAVENVLLGNENNLTFSLDGTDRLKSGDRYYVIVTSCNAAGHCVSAQSQDLLIDSSPPHLGGLGAPLLWKTNPGDNKSVLNLTWYGFHDQESSVLNYFITASRSYSGNELTDGEASAIHNPSVDKQQTLIHLQERIFRDDVLILSIWAQNKAGLNSSIARVTVVALSTSTVVTSEGILEHEKHSCDVHYCNKECTCAVLGLPCIEAESIGQCVDLQESEVIENNLPIVAVYGGLPSNPIQETASSACLTGHWEILSSSMKHISRFEWSIGIMNQPIGEGIFDLIYEMPWKDVGHRTSTVHCLTYGHTILHDHEYIIYVRAWYTNTQSAIFTSEPIKIDQTAPGVRRGQHITDSTTTCIQDLDFIDWTDTISACWANVFSDQQSGITHYVVSLGAAPGADDVFTRSNVGLDTDLTLTNLTLSHGTKYYFTVTAHTSLGLHTSTSSDGFVVDMDNPTNGVVYNTGNHTNAVYQSASDSFSVSWHGFADNYAGITRYLVAMTEEDNVIESSLVFFNSGLHTSHTFTNLHLQHGEKYVAVVKAVDAAGHESDIAFSPATTVDVTSPEGFECLNYQTIYFNETSCFENGQYELAYVPDLDCTSFYQIAISVSGRGTSEMTIDNLDFKLPIKVAYNGSSKIEHTFRPNCIGNGQLYLIGMCQDNTTIEAALRQCVDLVPTTDNAVTVVQMSPSLIQLEVMIPDTESHVRKLRVGLGTTPGGFQVAALTEVHKAHNGLFLVDVPHGTRIYATVIAENHAGLRSTFTARPVTMDHTAPVFTSSPSVTIEEETNTTYSALVTWDVVDEDSGIRQCICRLGTHQTLANLHRQDVTGSTYSCRFDNISLEHGVTVYAAVTCINGLELTTETYSRSDPVSTEPPSANTAAITAVTSSPLHVTNQQIPIQTNLTCLNLQWSGFYDVLGVEHYQYRLKNGNITHVDWVDTGKQTMASLKNLQLQSGTIYTAEVRAINIGGHSSDIVKTDVYAYGETPTLTDKPIEVSVSSENVQLNWTDVFNIRKGVDVRFTLNIGTERGYTDVIDGYQSIEMTHIFIIPRSTLMSPTVSELFIEVTCTFVTGISISYTTGGYKLP